MKVTMLTTVAGGSAYGSLTSGVTYDLPYDYAKSLVDAGSASYKYPAAAYSNPPDTVGPTAAAAVAAAVCARPQYVGLIAGRAGALSGFTGSNKNYKQSMLETLDTPARYIKCRFENWWLNNGVETATGSILKKRLWIEYPIGSTPIPATFAGLSMATIASGGYAESDYVDLGSIAPQGAQILFHYFGSTDNGFAYWTSNAAIPGATISSGSSIYQNSGESLRFSSDASVFSSGAIETETCPAGADPGGVPSSYLLMVRPSAIIGVTTRPSFAFLDNSRGQGIYDQVSDVTGLVGPHERTIGKKFAYTNLSAPGATLAQLATLANWAKRKAIIDAYCTHVVLMDPINDLAAGTTAATCLTNAKTVIAALAKPTYLQTCAPKTTGTFADDAGQTIDATSNTERGNWNARVLYGVKEAAGTIDINTVLESTTTSGKWAANLTGDGLHANKAGNVAVANSQAYRFLDFLQF